MTDETWQEKALKWHLGREWRAFQQLLGASGMPTCLCGRANAMFNRPWGECEICYHERTTARDYLETHRDEFPDGYTWRDLVADKKQKEWEVAYKRYCKERFEND